MFITMNRDHTLADLDHLGLSECAFVEEQQVCYIGTTFEDLYGEDYYEARSPVMESQFPFTERKNPSQVTIAMDGNYTLADLDLLGFSECKFDKEQQICNIDTALNDLYVEDYYQALSPDIWSRFLAIERKNLSQVTVTLDGDHTPSDLDHLGLTECKFEEDQQICNIDTPLQDLYEEGYYQELSTNMESWSPDIERENLSQGNGIMSSVNSNLEYSRFTQDFGKERSLSPSPPNDSNKISLRYQENHPAPIENSSFSPLPEPLMTVSLLFATCILFPLFFWLCYRCSFKKGAAKSRRTELSEVLVISLHAENARYDSTAPYQQ